jgi:hypothetical protein
MRSDDGYLSFGPFSMSEKSLRFHQRADNVEPGEWVSSAFKVLALVRYVDGPRWGIYIEFLDPDDRLRARVIQLADVHQRKPPVPMQLAAAGLKIAASQRAHFLFCDYLAKARPAARWDLIAYIVCPGIEHVLWPRALGKFDPGHMPERSQIVEVSGLLPFGRAIHFFERDQTYPDVV